MERTSPHVSRREGIGSAPSVDQPGAARSAKAAAGPLGGIRVLSLENYVAGPVATMLLADWGAEVVKVEPPRGDDYRHFPPVSEHDGQRTSPSFARVNRNKRSVVLDLKQARDAATFASLAEVADVIVENLKPGTMDKLGLGYPTLKERNRGLILVSITGFGHGDVRPGPFIDRPALDVVAQALSGLSYAVGTEEDPPAYLGLPLIDTTTGDWAAMATLLALIARQRTGEGQHIDVALYDVAMHLNEYNLGYYAFFGKNPPRGRIPTSAPFDYFRARDGWFALAVSSEAMWHRLCEAMGQPGLAQDPELSSGVARAAVAESRLRPIIERWSGDQTLTEVVDTLGRHGVPAAAAQRPEDVFHCEHAQARGAWITVPDPVLGEVRLVGNPIRSDGMRDADMRPAPQLGADTADVLASWISDQDENS